MDDCLDNTQSQPMAVISEERYKRSNTDLSVNSDSSSISVSEMMQRKINCKAATKNTDSKNSFIKRSLPITQNWAEDGHIADNGKYY
jgi:hypothetical protein